MGAAGPVGLGASRETITETPLMSSLPLTTWAIKSHWEGWGDAGLSLPPSPRHRVGCLHPWLRKRRRRKGCVQAQALRKMGGKKPSRSIFRALNLLKALCRHGFL